MSFPTIPTIASVAVIACLISGCSGQEQKEPGVEQFDTVRVRKLELVDGKGAQRALLDILPDGTVRFSLYGGNASAIHMFVGTDGSSELSLSSWDKPLLRAKVDSNGKAKISLVDFGLENVLVLEPSTKLQGVEK